MRIGSSFFFCAAGFFVRAGLAVRGARGFFAGVIFAPTRTFDKSLFFCHGMKFSFF